MNGPQRKKTIKKAKSKPHVQYSADDENHSASRLLKAGLLVFAKNGYHGATTKAIAEQAEVNESLITRHFKSKHGLFMAVLGKNVITNESITYPLAATIEEELIAFSDFIIARDVANIDFMKMVICHVLQNPGFAEEMKSKFTNLGMDLLEERLKKLARQEGLPSFDYGMVESIVHKIIFTGTFYSVMMGFQPIENSRKGIHKQIRFFWQGVKDSLLAKKTNKKAP